jgi:hypothetical protein
VRDRLAEAPGVFLTGSAYRGVGIADCVRQAGEAADRVRAYLAGPPGGVGPPGGGERPDGDERRPDVEQEAIS